MYYARGRIFARAFEDTVAVAHFSPISKNFAGGLFLENLQPQLSCYELKL